MLNCVLKKNKQPKFDSTASALNLLRLYLRFSEIFWHYSLNPILFTPPPVSSTTPNPPTSVFSLCDWQLLFACPCLKAKVSLFISRLGGASGWWKDLDRGGGGGGLGREDAVLAVAPTGWVLLGRGPGQKGWAWLIAKVTSLGCRQTTCTARQTSVHTRHVCVPTKKRENMHTH